MYSEYGGGFNYDTQRSIVISLTDGIWGKNLHDFSIKSTYRITTLTCFQDIWKIHLVYNKQQIHKFCESASSLHCYFKLVQWQCHIFIETHTSF